MGGTAGEPVAPRFTHAARRFVARPSPSSRIVQLGAPLALAPLALRVAPWTGDTVCWWALGDALTGWGHRDLPSYIAFEDAIHFSEDTVAFGAAVAVSRLLARPVESLWDLLVGHVGLCACLYLWLAARHLMPGPLGLVTVDCYACDVPRDATAYAALAGNLVALVMRAHRVRGANTGAAAEGRGADP